MACYVDPVSGEKKQVGPIAVKGKDTLDLIKADTGELFIKSSLGNYRLKMDHRNILFPFRLLVINV